MAPFEGIGGESKETAETHEDVANATTKLHRRLHGRFTTLLDGVLAEAGCEIVRHSSPVTAGTCAGATVKIGKHGAWVGIYFCVEQFLELAFKITPRVLRKPDKDALERLVREHGYALDQWKQQCRTLRLPEASGEQEGRQQIAKGAGFVREQVEIWRPVLEG